jgi:hypothetical protein
MYILLDLTRKESGNDARGLIVVNRDTGRFVAAGVPAFNPWHWTLHAGDRALRVGGLGRKASASRSLGITGALGSSLRSMRPSERPPKTSGWLVAAA